MAMTKRKQKDKGAVVPIVRSEEDIPDTNPVRNDKPEENPMVEVEPGGAVRPLGTDEHAEEKVRTPIDHPDEDAQ
jgi:hypothetical protein